MKKLLLYTVLFSCRAIAAADFNQQYNGSTTVIQPPEVTNSQQNNKPTGNAAFEQHFNGPTTIISKDPNSTVKPCPTSSNTASPAPTLVNAKDQQILEEFVRRGLMQKIKNGLLFLPDSDGFLALKSYLTVNLEGCKNNSKQKDGPKKP